MTKICYLIEEIIVSEEFERVLVQDAASICVEKVLENPAELNHVRHSFHDFKHLYWKLIGNSEKMNT